MAQRVRSLYPLVRIIALTGYNDFEYAKKGIDLGIDGYVLKPIDPEVIESTVRKSLDKINAVDVLATKTHQLTQLMKDYEPTLKEKLFFDIVNLHRRGEDQRASKADYGLDMKGLTYDVSVVEIVTKAKISDIEKSYVLMEKIKVIIEEEFEQQDQTHIFMNNMNHVVIYARRPHNKAYESLKACIYEIRVEKGLDILLGQSNAHDSFNELAEAYGEANHALAYGRVLGTDFHCHYNDIQYMENHFNKETSVDQSLDQLIFVIKTGLQEEMGIRVTSLFSAIRQDMQKLLYEEYITLQIYLARIVSRLDHYVLTLDSHIGSHMKGLEPYETLHDVRLLSKVHSLSEGKLYIENYCNNIISCSNSIDQKQDINMIDEINDYIKEHLDDFDLTLKGTAEKFYINSSYLSRIYKKQTGKSFKEKVISLRMEEAIRLLKSTDLKVYEVSYRIGIQDPNYFSLSFRKYMNMSISEYRKSFLKGVK